MVEAIRISRLIVRMPRRRDAVSLHATRSDPAAARFQGRPNPYSMDRAIAATPVFGHLGTVVGVLMAEVDLDPIVDLVVTREKFGATSDAHIAQPDGNGALITLLRFARDAAFTKVVPKSKALPINRSLVSPQPMVIHSLDYRASIRAVQTIERTGWETGRQGRRG